MVIVYPAVYFGWSPPIEYVPFHEDPLENLKMFVIPALISGLVSSAQLARYTRTMTLEILGRGYVRTAWSKGLKERAVVIIHCLKNTLIPVDSMIGLQVPSLIAGAVVFEQIFSILGLGRLVVDSLARMDYPIVSGVNLLIACAVLLINLGVDLIYAYLDPRIRYR